MIAIFRAIALLARDSRLRRLALLPFAVNVALVLIGLPILLWLGYHSPAWLLPALSDWPEPLLELARLLAALLAGILGIVFLLVVGRMLAAPMITRLTEAVEATVLGGAYVPRLTTLRDDAADVGRSVLFALGRLALFLLVYPLILLVGLIPAIGAVLGPALGFLYGAFVLSLDLSEPVFERHLPGFLRRVRYVLSRPVRYLGFGGASFLMALVPLANLAVLPVCSTAATLLFLEDLTKNRSS
jgi:CysZ protein